MLIANYYTVQRRDFCSGILGFPGGSDDRVCLHCGRPGLIPGSGRSPGEGNGNPLQYSCLENLTDRVAWGLQSMGSQESDMT